MLPPHLLVLLLGYVDSPSLLPQHSNILLPKRLVLELVIVHLLHTLIIGIYLPEEDVGIWVSNRKRTQLMSGLKFNE
jgi:uncharacterized protein HemY